MNRQHTTTVGSVMFLFCLVIIASCGDTRQVLLPGKLSDGRVRLPNGWFLSPSGVQVGVGELPLNMDVSPDEKHIIVTNNGTARQSISIVETASWVVTQTIPVRKSWLGLRFFNQGKQFLVSGGNDNRIYTFGFRNGTGVLADSIVVGPPWPTGRIWLGGLDIDESMGKLFVTGRENDSLFVIDLPTKTIAKRIGLPAKPYTCLVSRNYSNVYVSLWGGSAVAFINKKNMRIVASVRVGDHPCDMIESPDGDRLFVANANQNTVSVVDVGREKVIETISTALFPNAPAGSTPNALALSADGKRLYIANADNNCIAVMDVSAPGASRSLGFIPVGWYPTSVRVLKGTNQLVVANGKGLASQPNPKGPNPEKRVRTEEYIGSLFKGTLSRLDAPSVEELRTMSAQVYANSPYTDAKRLNPGITVEGPIPQRVGDPSPIKHVFYVIKENRTYDQVFGDLHEGNGDSTLCLFPERITPNHHALVREFVLLDNLYCDAEVSADGHNWSMGAYATDYVEKSWPTSYGGRGGEYEFEGGYPIVYPSAGYLWDNCARHNVSYRSYGEFAVNGSRPGDSTKASMASLIGHVAPSYRAWDLSYSDIQRVHDWEKEFELYEESGDLPQFQVIKLPNDHTEGTHKESLTPRAFVAQNDRALGLLVERISRSRFWKESAIFVIEDDAQNGPDHVDAHRTVALVISPYTKRKFVDSELYSTSSMVRTMELILGLPPMSQFDAAATPMDHSFSASPDLAPYAARAAGVDLEERNMANAFGQERSDTMDFSREDAIPEAEFGEIVWKAMRGASSEMPAPVRSAFVRVVRDE